MGFQKSIPYKNPRHGAPGPIGTSKSNCVPDNRQSDTCDCLDRLCNFVTISNDLEYFNSGTLPKKGKFSDRFFYVFREINRSDEF